MDSSSEATLDLGIAIYARNEYTDRDGCVGGLSREGRAASREGRAASRRGVCPCRTRKRGTPHRRREKHRRAPHHPTVPRPASAGHLAHECISRL